MTATMIKMDNGYFIPKLEGFDDIKKDIIKVDIDIIDDEIEYDNIYKQQLRDAIVEHYEVKKKNQVEFNMDSQIVEDFRKKHNLQYSSLSEFLKDLK